MYVLELKDIYFSYNGAPILKGISINVEKGKFVSIIGPNGSGKSTLLKTINNIYIPEKGSVLVDEKNISLYKSKELAKKIALVPQDTVIDYDFTVAEIVMMGRYPYMGRFTRENEDDYRIVDDVMKMTNIISLKDRLITKLSGGERQRVFIARALAQNPSIILLDEPTSHLDINHQMDILNLLQDLNKVKGTTIILVIHDINLAARYSDEVILMDSGCVIGAGKPEEVITLENMEKAYNIKVAIDINKYTKATYLTPLEILSK